MNKKVIVRDARALPISLLVYNPPYSHTIADLRSATSGNIIHSISLHLIFFVRKIVHCVSSDVCEMTSHWDSRSTTNSQKNSRDRSSKHPFECDSRHKPWCMSSVVSGSRCAAPRSCAQSKFEETQCTIRRNTKHLRLLTHFQYHMRLHR